jgi:3-deoxy-D-manno-octulosonic-acid transferase
VYLIYSFLLTVGFLILLPRFAIDAFRNGKYVTGLSERLGRIPRSKSVGTPSIWLHCVSVGETEAAKPLVRALRQALPGYRLVISTTTVTGQQVARRAFADAADLVFYFPIDWARTVRRVLNALDPAAVLIMETELWPNLLRECRRRSTPVALINGRISPTSFRRYSKIRPFMRRVLGDLTAGVMQSDADSKRIATLGLEPARIHRSGNLKFDSAMSELVKSDLQPVIRERFAFTTDQPLIVAASTHSPEEAILLTAFKQILTTDRRPRLLLVPRHPERFDEVAKLIASTGLSWSRRSAPPSPNDANSTIVLLDSIGELRAVYESAALVFVGGSLIRHGGQNLLEPAAQGVCIVTGAHTHNFADITRALLEHEAVIQLPDLPPAEAATPLASLIANLLGDDSRRKAIGQRAREVCGANRGATDRTLSIIAELLSSSAGMAEPLPLPAAHLSAAK